MVMGDALTEHAAELFASFPIVLRLALVRIGIEAQATEYVRVPNGTSVESAASATALAVAAGGITATMVALTTPQEPAPPPDPEQLTLFPPR